MELKLGRYQMETLEQALLFASRSHPNKNIQKEINKLLDVVQIEMIFEFGNDGGDRNQKPLPWEK